MARRQPDEELRALRAQVTRLHNNATAKVGRMRRAGTDISGTQLDPRTDKQRISRMNRAQLAKQAERLQAFNNRNVGYVQTSGGIVTRKSVEILRARERAHNARVAKHLAKVGDIMLPNLGYTVKELEDIKATKRRTSARGEAVNKPFQFRNTDINNVNGITGIRRLIDDMNNRAKPGYLKSKLDAGRRDLNTSIDHLGDPIVNVDGERIRLSELASQLDDSQFDVIWNYAQFADIVYNYISERPESDTDATISNDIDSIGEILGWARTLPTQQSAA